MGGHGQGRAVPRRGAGFAHALLAWQKRYISDAIIHVNLVPSGHRSQAAIIPITARLSITRLYCSDSPLTSIMSRSGTPAEE